MKKNKTISRRSFVSNGFKAAAFIPFVGVPLTCFGRTKEKTGINTLTNTPKPLDILILGGSSFLGPHQIAYALERGHKVTTFTRGKTAPTVHKDYYSKAEHLIGDRENNLEALKGRKWDAVIDNSGRKVAWTEATAELLKDAVGMYVYISSVSVFYPYYKANLKEEDPLVLKVPEDAASDERFTYDYGVMKANSELAAERIFGKERTAVVRPTFMAGPADRTNRFLYWPTQLVKGNDVIIPGKKDDPVQFIDVRDIADFTIRILENNTTGVFNGVGPEKEMSVTTFVQKAHEALDSKSKLISIDDSNFLRENNLRFQAPWVLDSEKFHGISRVNNQRAVTNGLRFRSLEKTILDTHNWWNSDAVAEERKDAFLSDANELHNRQKDLLEKWKTLRK
ncbi:MAG: NAD-dependent epimerase/dehydratase family protein [Flavobacteriaceae bacterium]|nr:NAD-dependent epimerase/dehydratase family protein [Flavobacteriaceae bacterium]